MRTTRFDLICFRQLLLIVALALAGLTGEAMAAKTKKAGTAKKPVHAHAIKKRARPAAVPKSASSPSLFDQIVVGAETKASSQGKAVLRVGKEMIANNEIGSKGCWDYINQLYSRAGFSAKKRQTLYQSKKQGPYSRLDDIQPGDWLYYVNHSYGDIEHSGIFIDWVSRERNEALMLSYAGENRKEAARYKTYDLSNVYRIIRPHGDPARVAPAKKIADQPKKPVCKPTRTVSSH